MRNDPRFITARFDSVCQETRLQIKKGQEAVYYPLSRKCYHAESKAADEVRGLQFAETFCMPDAAY